MRNWQIRKVTIAGSDFQDLSYALRGVGHGFERGHDTLWLSSTSRRVNDGCHFIFSSLDWSRDGRTCRDHVVPLLGMQCVLWTEGKGHGVHSTGNACLHFLPRLLVELSNENHLGLRMLQNVASCFGSKCWVNRDRDMASEHNAKVRNHPMGAVLGADSNLRFWWISEGFNVTGHFLGLVQNFLIGESLDVSIPTAHGLGQESLTPQLLHIVRKVVNNSLRIV
mmetsp:Transcript_3755/g.8081  ORF Transcript_3755/g.8081 Transcript_3755/m.8081 type:complete len:223 (+) Transcript_3755:1343-2011(+)